MDTDGNPCVKAQAYISILDLVRNRPVRFNDTDLARYQPEPDTVIEVPVKKVATPKEFIAEKTLVVRRSDIDFNEHVHNTTYLAFAMEVLPEELYKEQNFEAIRINFKKALMILKTPPIQSTMTTFNCPSSISAAGQIFIPPPNCEPLQVAAIKISLLTSSIFAFRACNN